MSAAGLELRLGADVLEQLAERVAQCLSEDLCAGMIAMNPKQAAAACGVSTKTLQRAVAAGELVSSRIGARTVYLPGDLEAWVRARRAPNGLAGSFRALHAERPQRKRPALAARAGGAPREDGLDERNAA